MKLDKLQKLKEVIWKANPSILKLQFGCDVINLITNEKTIIIDYDDGMDVYLLANGKTSPSVTFSSDGYYKILGRKIGIADVLYWQRFHTGENAYDFISLKIILRWDLLHDDIDWHAKHKPETINFLTDLLV